MLPGEPLAHLLTYLPACLPTYLPAYLPTYLPTYLLTHSPMEMKEKAPQVSPSSVERAICTKRCPCVAGLARA